MKESIKVRDIWMEVDNLLGIKLGGKDDWYLWICLDNEKWYERREEEEWFEELWCLEIR